MKNSKWLPIAGGTVLASLVLSLTVIRADDKKGDKKKDEKVVTTKSGLKYEDLKVGDGAEAKAGDTVEVHYTGWLKDDKKFDSSVDRKEPFSFKLGAGRVIKGWDEGVAGMKVGGKRKLIIPPELGYGARGAGNVIPAKRRITFGGRVAQAKVKPLPGGGAVCAPGKPTPGPIPGPPRPSLARPPFAAGRTIQPPQPARRFRPSRDAVVAPGRW